MTYKNGIIEGEMGIYADNQDGLLEERKYEKGKLLEHKIYPPKRKQAKSKGKK